MPRAFTCPVFCHKFIFVINKVTYVVWPDDTKCLSDLYESLVKTKLHPEYPRVKCCLIIFLYGFYFAAWSDDVMFVSDLCRNKVGTGSHARHQQIFLLLFWVMWGLLCSYTLHELMIKGSSR